MNTNTLALLAVCLASLMFELELSNLPTTVLPTFALMLC